MRAKLINSMNKPTFFKSGFLLFLFCDSFVLPIASCLFFFVELYKATDPTFVCVSLSIVVVVDDDVFCCKFVRAAPPCASSRFGQVSRSDRCDEYLSSFVFFFCCGVLVLRFCQGDNTGERTQDGIDGRRLSLRRHSLPPPPPAPPFLRENASLVLFCCEFVETKQKPRHFFDSYSRVPVCVCARACVSRVFLNDSRDVLCSSLCVSTCLSLPPPHPLFLFFSAKKLAGPHQHLQQIRTGARARPLSHFRNDAINSSSEREHTHTRADRFVVGVRTRDCFMVFFRLPDFGPIANECKSTPVFLYKSPQNKPTQKWLSVCVCVRMRVSCVRVFFSSRSRINFFRPYQFLFTMK